MCAENTLTIAKVITLFLVVVESVFTCRTFACMAAVSHANCFQFTAALTT